MSYFFVKNAGLTIEYGLNDTKVTLILPSFTPFDMNFQTFLLPKAGRENLCTEKVAISKYSHWYSCTQLCSGKIGQWPPTKTKNFDLDYNWFNSREHQSINQIVFPALGLSWGPVLKSIVNSILLSGTVNQRRNRSVLIILDICLSYDCVYVKFKKIDLLILLK